ncbi:MAG: FimB/Mfa2 family fimbrial subunit [Alistipes sp.]|nr:FimB/Mfa2 family fimbrial subunit [Alistipes sp.]
MKKIVSAYRFHILSLCLGLVFASCIKDDTDDCYPAQPQVRIVVKTLAEVTRPETTGTDQIDNVWIYIFDGEERFMGTWIGGAYTHGELYEAYLDLEPGNYHFVAWTNQGEVYNTIDATKASANDYIVGLTYPEDHRITEDIPDLHHGMISDAEVVPDIENEFTIVIKPNTYRLNFTVQGLDETPDDYAFSVTDNNSHYYFDNSIIEDQEEIQYFRSTAFAGAELKASMKVLRLMETRTPWFQFADLTEDNVMYEDNLVKMIKTAYETSGQTVDFDSTFEFDITLIFNANLGVTIDVNSWSYTQNPTEL